MKPVMPLAALAAGVGLAAGLAVTQASASSAGPQGQIKGQIPDSVLPGLTTLAYQWAAREGDSSPASVLAVRTTLARAMHLADRADSIPDSTGKPVYLVIEKGHFHPAGVLAVPGPAKTDRELIFGANHLIIDVVGVGDGSKLTPTVTFSMLRRLGPVARLAPP